MTRRYGHDPRSRTPGLATGRAGPAVQGGDAIALVTPGAQLGKKERSKAIAFVERFFASSKRKPKKVPIALRYQAGSKPNPTFTSPSGYTLGGTDQVRAEEMAWALTSPEVTAIVCERGGYGSMRMLERLDAEVRKHGVEELQAAPRRLCGYSDITAVHAWLFTQVGWAALHAPMLYDAVPGHRHGRTSDALFRALTGDVKDLHPGGVVSSTLTWVGSPQKRIEGVLLGGNLSLLEAMYGSRYLPSFQGCIVFLEETSEHAHDIDRMLVALRDRGAVREVLAVVTGDFTDCEPSANKPKDWARLVADAWSGIPVFHHLAVGHGAAHGRPNEALWLGRTHRLEVGSAAAELKIV